MRCKALGQLTWQISVVDCSSFLYHYVSMMRIMRIDFSFSSWK